MSSDFIQPLLKISGLPVIYFGVVYALMRVIVGIGGSLTQKLVKFFTLEKLLFIGFAGIIGSFLGFSFETGSVIILMILLLKLSEGFNRILLEDEVKRHIKSQNRTTILSISSFFESLFNAGLVFVFGIMADLVGVQFIFNYALILFLITITFVLLFIRSNKENILKKIQT